MRRFAMLVLFACLVGQGCPSTSPPPQQQVSPDPGPDDETPPPSVGAPTATFTIKKNALKATFDASGVSSPLYSASDIQVRWDYTNDGTYDTEWSTKKTTTYTYPEDGIYTVRLEIKDPQDQTDTATKQFTIKATNTPPTATFAVNLVQGMTASVDASSSSDAEDLPEDLRVRWDWDGDNVFDTDWTTEKTAEHRYTTAGEYTIKLQVRDLNDTNKVATQTIIASPITIRNGFLTYGRPYMIQLHFRMVNNLTGQPVTPADVPALTREHFAIYEDGLPIDLSETNQMLYNGVRPMYLALVLDFTGSMYDAGAVGPMLEAARDFIDSQGDNTWISLWGFWERQNGNAEITDFVRCTPDGKAAMKASLDAFAAMPRDRGATEIWDLLKKIMDQKFADQDTGINRGIVFLSDGHDTTSTTKLNTLIQTARSKAMFFFSVGLAFRPEVYPADEQNLKRLAEETGGLYFTVNQVSDLATVFIQLSQDVRADWTLSYITLKNTGTVTVKAICDYMDGYAVLTGKFPVTDHVRGDIKQGLLAILHALESPAGHTEYIIYAGYIPRNISTFKFRLTCDHPAYLTLYDNDAICLPADGWTITPDVTQGDPLPEDGWYTLSSITPLEYGSWGPVARLTVATDMSHQVMLELPPIPSQPLLYGDKTMIFVANGTTTIVFP